VVVIQEWWGLNDQIKGVADKMAAAGYRALVPDLYRGKVALEANEAQHLMTGLNFGDAAGQDVRGAVQYLKGSGSAKAGVTGFCMGGALTVLAAVNVPETDACVIWYGFPPLEYVDASKIKAALMGHWAIDDEAFPIGKVDELEAKLRTANGFESTATTRSTPRQRDRGPKTWRCLARPERSRAAWRRIWSSSRRPGEAPSGVREHGRVAMPARRQGRTPRRVPALPVHRSAAKISPSRVSPGEPAVRPVALIFALRHRSTA
jgi:hypothetical protein